jgi:hypothetical protein
MLLLVCDQNVLIISIATCSYVVLLHLSVWFLEPLRKFLGFNHFLLLKYPRKNEDEELSLVWGGPCMDM